VGVTFEGFVRVDGVRLRAGLVAAYGPEVGQDAAARRWPMAGSIGIGFRQ
jgi:hypothetical protein